RLPPRVRRLEPCSRRACSPYGGGRRASTPATRELLKAPLNEGPPQMPNESEKIIYSMIGVSKSYDKKVVLKDIYLSYFYGAKIGVLGLNGSGKSSLLKILAGVDKKFEGKISLAPGFTVGYLEQEPQLDPALTARQVVEQGAQQTIDLLKEFERINEKFAEPM